MKLQILEERQNQALQRKELKVLVDYEGGATPKTADVASELAKHLGIDAGLIDVRKLVGATGCPKGTALVNVWASPEVREAMKPKKRAKPAKAAPA